MTVLEVVLACAVVPLLVASGGCSAAETAIFSLRHGQRVRLRRLSPYAAHAAANLLAQPRAVLVTILILNNLINVCYFVATTLLAMRVDHPWLSVATASGSVLSLLVAGEILPKLLARHDPAGWARWLAPPLLGAMRILEPVARTLEGIVGALARLARPHPPSPLSLNELSLLLEQAARQGDIDPDQEQVLAAVLELGALRVRDIMTPRVDLPLLERAAIAREAADLALRWSGRFVPVLSHREGHVIGLLDLHGYLAARSANAGRRDELADAFLIAPWFVPETARLDSLLAEFRRTRQELALCVNEYGTFVGAVSLDDVLARLVGIEEEALPAAEGVTYLGNGCFIVPGSLPVAELRRVLDQPVGRWGSINTVGGLILLALGRLPQVGDAVRVANLHLEVLALRGRRIERVRLTLLPRPDRAHAQPDEHSAPSAPGTGHTA